MYRQLLLLPILFFMVVTVMFQAQAQTIERKPVKSRLGDFEVVVSGLNFTDRYGQKKSAELKATMTDLEWLGVGIFYDLKLSINPQAETILSAIRVNNYDLVMATDGVSQSAVCKLLGFEQANLKDGKSKIEGRWERLYFSAKDSASNSTKDIQLTGHMVSTTSIDDIPTVKRLVCVR